jgi:hypothetical protein
VAIATAPVARAFHCPDMPEPWWLGVFKKGLVTMIDIKFSGDLTLLSSDELSGVNGGFLTGSGGCALPAPPTPTSAPSAYETSTATHWNWGGPHNVRLMC